MPITIGIPFYNAEAYLTDAIKSIFAQTYQDWELILVDDGSTDRSLEIASSIKDPRVRVLSDGQNRKLPYRLNQITSEAKYDFIGRMDADDLISPFRFEKQLDILKTQPKIDLVTTGICSISKDNRLVGMRYGSSDETINGKKLLRGQCTIVHAAMLGRKSWFVRNPYDETAVHAEDFELWLRAFTKKDFRLHIMNEPLYYYREENSERAGRMISAYQYQIKQIKKYSYIGFNGYELLLEIAKFHFKSVVVRGLDLLSKTDILIKNRNASIIKESLLRHFKEEIEMILKTNLPK
jgi:glycosyltransferase involved in cell wall biosynthesis